MLRLGPQRDKNCTISSVLCDVRSGAMSVRAASKTYSIPRSTLSDRITGKVLEGALWGKTISTLSRKRNRDMIML